MSARVSDIWRASSFLAGEGEMEGGGCYGVKMGACCQRCDLPQCDPSAQPPGLELSASEQR